MRRSIPIGLLVVSLAALFVVGGTMAWFTHTAEPVINTFTAGTVEIEIVDEYTEVTNWNPGDTTDKKVSVKSLGTKGAYVRVSLTPVWGSMVEDEFAPDQELSTENVVLNVNTGEDDDWMLSDGWYYYKKILPAGEETSLLLNSVTLVGESTGNEYQGKILQIIVEAEAVQASNDAYQSVWSLKSLPWVEEV